MRLEPFVAEEEADDAPHQRAIVPPAS
jgi:hypothetical protein